MEKCCLLIFKLQLSKAMRKGGKASYFGSEGGGQAESGLAHTRPGPATSLLLARPSWTARARMRLLSQRLVFASVR